MIQNRIIKRQTDKWFINEYLIDRQTDDSESNI